MLLDDFDGDGKTDILAPAGTVWYVYRWNGTGFTPTSTLTTVDASLVGGQATPADFDGDGLPDLINDYGYGAHLYHFDASKYIKWRGSLVRIKRHTYFHHNDYVTHHAPADSRQ